MVLGERGWVQAAHHKPVLLPPPPPPWSLQKEGNCAQSPIIWRQQLWGGLCYSLYCLWDGTNSQQPTHHSCCIWLLPLWTGKQPAILVERGGGVRTHVRYATWTLLLLTIFGAKLYARERGRKSSAFALLYVRRLGVPSGSNAGLNQFRSNQIKKCTNFSHAIQLTLQPSLIWELPRCCSLPLEEMHQSRETLPSAIHVSIQHSGEGRAASVHKEADGGWESAVRKSAPSSTLNSWLPNGESPFITTQVPSLTPSLNYLSCSLAKSLEKFANM